VPARLERLARRALLLGREPPVLIGVEAAQRPHAALEALAHDELPGGALLATGQLTVAVLVELLEDALAHLAALARLAGLALGAVIGGRDRGHAADEREGEDDLLHAALTRGRREG
jgi:hypothetical protein